MTTLDGRCLIVTVDEIINPKTVVRVEGEGMPVFSKKNIHRVKPNGDLFVKFEI